jgi:hypothetical protein
MTDHEDHTCGAKELAGSEQLWWLSNREVPGLGGTLPVILPKYL